ncbi:hypothetical protein ABTM24_19800, partial [Acinetobacter baumannii]
MDFHLGQDADTYSYINSKDSENLRLGIKRFFDDVWADVGPKVSRKFLIPGRAVGVLFSVQGFYALPEASAG